jgi:hypothetical protein
VGWGGGGGVGRSAARRTRTGCASSLKNLMTSSYSHTPTSPNDIIISLTAPHLTAPDDVIAITSPHRTGGARRWVLRGARRARRRECRRQPALVDRGTTVVDHLGFGRTAVSEIEAPNI